MTAAEIQFVSQSILNYSLYGLYINIDRGLLEKSGPSGSVSSVRAFSSKLKDLQSGDTRNYLFLFVMAFCTIFFTFVYPNYMLVFASLVVFFSN